MRQPLVVAVTGHRDLVPAEWDGIRDRVRILFGFLRESYPDLELRLLSPLAEGADQLVAQVACEMKVPLVVPLPMAVPDYLDGFATPEGKQRFHSLCEAAEDIFVLSSNDQDDVAAQHFARLGIFMASHCHILLAIWDGKDSDQLGGTSQVVSFHHDDIMPGYEGKTGVSQQMLIDDESDLVCQVVCSRDRPGGEPATGLTALDWWWFTKDDHEPRSKELPPSHDRVLQRANEFSYDASRFERRTVAEAGSLLSDTVAELDIDGLDHIDATFRSADFLAMHYQRKSLRTLRSTHILAFAMGAMFILYSDIAKWQLLLYLFLGCFGAATVLQGLAVRRGWFRKYLDYRTLAEGLRVQFYWALAGIPQDGPDQYSHDNFLQSQDPEVGWIRNSMRVAGSINDALPNEESSALEISITEWIGDDHNGQLGYYARKAVERINRRRITDTIGRISLLASAAVVVVLLVAGSEISASVFASMLAAMGITLLLFAVRHGYAHAIGESDLIKQYEFMLRIFANARRRLRSSLDDEKKRQILMAVGRSALDEHAQWIMMHRERSLDQTEIWRMGSGS